MSMLGRHHLMISLGTVAPFLMPFLDDAGLAVMTVFFGVAVGSLIPDSDSSDAAIFHGNVRGLNGDIGGAVNNLFAPVFPFFGYTTKYLIYKPAVVFFDRLMFQEYSFSDKHRSFSHSILGVATMTLMTGVYLAPLLLLLEVFSFTYFTIFLSAYASGAFLHMLEDSCTKTGIKWNSPFSETRLKGELTTSSKPEHVRRPRYMVYMLGTISVATLLLANTETYGMTDLKTAGAGFLLTALAWILFALLAAEVELERE